MSSHTSSPEPLSRQPLAGIRVLDLSRVLAGPYCAQLLADMGADVVKLEGPEGDENRRWAPLAANGESCNFMSVNRGKLGIAVDLKSADGQDILKRLIARSDVVIQSFRQGAARRLGVDHAGIAAINPRAVVCSISGYGGEGKMSAMPGYDLMLQAFAGIMSITGERDGPPARAGVSFLDLGSGMLAYGGIMTALFDRRNEEAAGRPGVGQHVQVSLLETAISFLGYHAIGWLNAGVLPQAEGSGVWHLVPYQAFACADGHLLVGATNDATWQRLCGAIGSPELADDPRFSGNLDRIRNRGALITVLEDILRADSMAAWMARLEPASVPAAPVQNLAQALTHPQVLANDMIVRPAPGSDDDTGTPDTGTDEARERLLGLPFKLSGTPGRTDGANPRLGEHTASVLADVLGFSQQDIDRLIGQGAIKTWVPSE